MNYQSDFRIVFSFPENKLPQYPWRLELSTPNTPGYNVFVAWFDGENYHNCKPQEDGTLLVPVDNHDLAPGVLTYKINIDDADADFPDGFMNVTIPGTMAVELWAGPSDEFAGEIGVVVLPVKGDPGRGVASGGKTGQMLAKQSDEDYDTVWVDPPSAPTINVVQTTGQSEADVMSQKAVTDALDKKVDAEEGKGLSSNDYTNLDKNKVASAVLYNGAQTLTPQQQEQARKNINSAPGYYNQNGFVISPLGMSAIAFRYIAYKEEQNSTICYILTKSRCLKMDFETYEVFWDVKVEGATSTWSEAAECLRVIGNVVYVIRAGWNIQGGIYLVQLDDSDGSTIQVLEIPIKVNYVYANFRSTGCPLITENYIYAVDTVDKQIKSFNINTLETSIVRDNISSFIGYRYQQLLWITNEENKPELVMINWFDDIIHLMRQDGTTIEIELSGSYIKTAFCIYKISLYEHSAVVSTWGNLYHINNIQGSNGKYSGTISLFRSFPFYYNDNYSNSEYNVNIDTSMNILYPLGSIPSIMSLYHVSKGALFLSNNNATTMIADIVSTSGDDNYTNIKKVTLFT